MGFWTALPEWAGETAFVICGGPSVTQEDVDRLKGRRVVVLNSSYEKAPWADVLFFGDKRWWSINAKKVRAGFSGRIITVRRPNDWQSAPKGSLVLEKVTPPPPLSSERTKIAMDRTSVQAAINLLVHFGVKRIVLLGADMKADAKGRTHHHSKHPWPSNQGHWDVQMKQLRTLSKPLNRLGISVVNTSMESRIDWWPKRPLIEVLNE